MEHDERLKMVATMKRYGGSFVVALSECFVRADANNLQRLYAAFPEIVNHYREMAKANPIQRVADKVFCPACGCKLSSGGLCTNFVCFVCHEVFPKT
jgi:hypothetical protein